MVQNSSGQTAREVGGSKKESAFWLVMTDEVENVATQPGVITFTDSQDGRWQRRSEYNLNVMQLPQTTTSQSNQQDAYTEHSKLAKTIFTTANKQEGQRETDEQTSFFDMQAGVCSMLALSTVDYYY